MSRVIDKINTILNDIKTTDKEVYEAGADPTGTWIAYKSATVFKRFKNREEMKKFIASNDGYKSASSEYFADKIKKKK